MRPGHVTETAGTMAGMHSTDCASQVGHLSWHVSLESLSALHSARQPSLVEPAFRAVSRDQDERGDDTRMCMQWLSSSAETSLERVSLESLSALHSAQ